VRAATAGLLLVAAVAPAYSWGPTGHHVVAIIAEQRLSPGVKQRVDRLLFDGRYTLRDIAVCADQIRGSGAPSAGRQRYPVDPICTIVAGNVAGNTAPWHYIDIPLPGKERDLQKFCPNGDCIVDQIERFERVLRESPDDAARRQALLFVVHFIGDIHQPMHAVERGCDQGGNRELVNFYLDGEERANDHLHRVWDSGLVDVLMKKSGFADESDLALDLQGRIDEDEAAGWARAGVRQMAWESYRDAKKHAYRGIPFQDFCTAYDPKAQHATNLTGGYESDGARVVRERLMKAGVRLAAALQRDLTR
jgi:hypothetical protein